jgi:hypothetical protein
MSVQDGVMNLTFDYQVKLWLGSDGLRLTISRISSSLVSRSGASRDLGSCSVHDSSLSRLSRNKASQSTLTLKNQIDRILDDA